MQGRETIHIFTVAVVKSALEKTLGMLAGVGIQLTPEYNCLEAGFMRDVTVRNNVIDSLGQGIWVGGCTSAEGDSPPAPYHHNANIVIENNSISHSQKVPFIVTSSERVTVRTWMLRSNSRGPWHYILQGRAKYSLK